MAELLFLQQEGKKEYDVSYANALDVCDVDRL